MKIYIDEKNYIDIKLSEKEDSVVMVIKARKNGEGAVLITATLSEDQVDKVISNLVTARAKIKYE